MNPVSSPGARRHGFTLIELLVVITIIGILAAIALPNYIKAKDKAKEVQAKSACHSIQIAIERYQVDREEYPQFLLGGDREGWRVWHERYDEPNPVLTGVFNAWVDDILIKNGYMDTYPNNPFVDNGIAVIRSTGAPTGPGGAHQAGDGDPRFGFRGDTMGNGLDHPQIFRNWYNYLYLNLETARTLACSMNGNGGNQTVQGFGNPTAANGSGNEGLHYMMGGRRAKKTENGQQVIYTAFTHWPGNFLYRGFGEHWKSRKGWTVYLPNAFVKTEVNRYELGCYGSYTTEGIDLIRMEGRNDNNGQMYYALPPPWVGQTDYALGFNAGGLPEINGGGDKSKGPWYPPNASTDYPNSWIYGAPDGFKDGVILALNPGDEVQKY